MKSEFKIVIKNNNNNKVMSLTKSDLEAPSPTKAEIDAIFDAIDFKFDEQQVSNIVNETCKPKIFKEKTPPFNLKIDQIKKDLVNGYEVELRYGYFMGNKFVPGVPKEAYYNLLEALNSRVPGVKAVETVDYIVQEGDSSIRIVENNGKRSIHSKTRLNSKDVRDWGLRIASAKEEPFSNPEKELDRYGDDMAGRLVRRKIRHTFPMTTRQWDLTIVSDPNKPHQNPVFEVEIEYYPEAINDKLGFEKRAEKDYKNGLMMMYKSSEENLMSMRELDLLMSSYNNLFDDCNSKKVKGRFFEIENKPGSFKFTNIFKGKEYWVTPKLDGLRRRLFIDVNGIFIVNPGTRYAQQIAGPYAPTEQTAIADTIIDTEYYDGGSYETSPKYFPFDVLIFDGESYLNKPFSERITKARAINIDIFDFSKPFFVNGALLGENGSGNFFDSYARCVEWQDEHPDIAFDGQIAQAEDPPYKSFNTMKIKPPEELTVDLHTTIDSKGAVTLQSYTSDQGMQVEKFGEGTPVKWKDIRGDGPKKVKSGFIGEYNLLEEFPFVKFKGFRRDKIKPNFSKVVDSVRRSFYDDPITEDDLLGETLLPWRKWASANKRDEIEMYIPKNARILDVGVGRGGTLLAAAKRGSQVYGIDPDEKNLEDLWDRIHTSVENDGAWDEHMEERVNTLVAKGQDTEKIVEFIGSPVTAALSMFSLSFFYESEKDLDALIETLDQTLYKSKEQGGVVIFNFMDGDKVGYALKDKKISNELYTIKLGHKNKTDKKGVKAFKEDVDVGVGVPISIKFEKERDPIFKYQEEWLAPYDILVKKMKAKGFVAIKNVFLDSNAILPESNMEFAGLNRSVVFQRGKVSGKVVGRRQIERKEQEAETFGLQELEHGKSSKIVLPVDSETLDGLVYVKDGTYTRYGVEWDDSSFLRSLLFLLDEEYANSDKEARDAMIAEYRVELNSHLDKKMFSRLMKGNVEARLAFDKLYTKENGKIIGTKPVAVEAGFLEYKGRVSTGAVGHEIGPVVKKVGLAQKVHVVDSTGRLLYTFGKGKQRLYILKIGDYAYAPLKLE